MGYKDILTLQAMNGTKAKQSFLAEHRSDVWLRTFLYYALNPLITYNLTERTIRSVISSFDPGTKLQAKDEFKTIFDCCEFLSGLKAMDSVTLLRVQSFLCSRCKRDDERELYVKLLSKTLELGITAKAVNKVMGELIPVWEIQRAFPIEKYPLEDGTEFWLTQKLDGVRATFYDGKLISGNGSPYTGLNHILKELSFIIPIGIVLDGMLTLKDKEGLSGRDTIMAVSDMINSDEADKTMICFIIFDAVPIRDFLSNTPTVLYEHRRLIMEQLEASLSGYAQSVRVLPVLYHGTNQSMICIFLEQMVLENADGIMVNTNVPYKRTRHRGIFKVKKRYDTEASYG